VLYQGDQLRVQRQVAVLAAGAPLIIRLVRRGRQERLLTGARPGPGPARRGPAAPARQLRPRHPRHPAAPLPGHPGEIISNGNGITVKINRQAYSPVLRHADLPADTAVPWWGGRQLRFEFT